MDKIDYKKIVNAAIGEKPSLVETEQPEWLNEADRNFKADFYRNLADCFKLPNKIFDYPRTPDQSYEYKQQGFLPFANPPRFTQEY
jgi:hypothetical protein